MDQFEDKVLLLNQHLRDMEEALEHKEAGLRHLNASRRQVGEEMEKYRAEIDRLEKDLAAALQKDKDDIGRFLIKKLKPMQSHIEKLQRHEAQIDRETADLQESLSQQRMEYEQLRLRAREYARKSEHRQWESILDTASVKAYPEPCDQEIELELLRRKENLQQGGSS
jgi:phage shock protein A